MRIFAVFGVILGLIFAFGGGYLLSLGGSGYYLLAGFVLIANGALAWKKQSLAYSLYAAFLAVTLAWALWESGYYWWALAARMGLLLILAIPLLLVNLPGRAKLASVWAIVALISLGSLFNDPFDKSGNLATEQVNAGADLGESPEDGWQAYGRSNMGQRYSPLTQIAPDNVDKLEQAWVYQTGDTKGEGDPGETTYEATPLKIGNSLYLCTPHNWLIALDADTGEERWVYNAKVGKELQRQHQTCRGVSYKAPETHSVPQAEKQSQPSETLAAKQCDAKLYMPTSDARLLALDPQTGALCKDFGDNGAIDLTQGMPFKQDGYYYSTSPPVVENGMVIVAGAVNDNYNIHSPSGVIRGYDADSGELVWNWDPAQPEQTQPIAGDDTYTESSPNSWSVASSDPELGLVYFPMGNRTPDQLGMYRSEAEEKYATSVVALHIDTGKVAWVQQFVHHDLWDMDTPAQPVLFEHKAKDGTQTPALLVPTKQGDVYVLNRETGEPIFPVYEEKAPQGTIPGDHAAATQPTSGLSFKPEPLTGQDMWGATPVDQMICRIQFHKLRYEGRYTPPSEQGTLVYPGNFGVFNWGSVAVDPERQAMFGMPLYLAFVSKLIPNDGKADLGPMNQGEQGVNANEGGPYSVSLSPFLSVAGIPCQQPPWGYVAGVDLQTGEKVWQHKNGTTYDMTPFPLPIKLGMPGIGGPVITKGGVVFMSAAVDNFIRAYDLTTGEVLWKARLPAGGQATPMTYMNSKGEQMVIQVAGGHGSIGTTLGDYVVAYKLKK